MIPLLNRRSAPREDEALKVQRAQTEELERRAEVLEATVKVKLREDGHSGP